MNDRRLYITVSLMIGMFLAAMEATIVATAMPTIVSSLGGFALYSWVFSSFLLTQAVTIPVYGKLADLYGRKPVYLAGVGLFILGALAAGLARSMIILVMARAVQGLGAGAVQPIATTIIGDIYTLEERARMQGLLSSVWGISSIIGPLLGGFIVEHFHWSWVFYINAPIGLLAMLGIIFFFEENTDVDGSVIDGAGTALLLTGTTALLLFVMQGGVAWEWVSLPSLLLLGLGVVLLIWFVRQEQHHPQPVLPLHLFKDRIVLIGNIGALLAGGLTMGATTYIPTFAQGVLGTTPTVAGFVLTVMSIGWPLASAASGFVMLAIGYRLTSLLGTLLTVIGTGVLFSLDQHALPWHVAAGVFLLGAGLGFATNTFIVSIQSSVDWEERGAATSSNMFARMLGSTIWVAVLGSVLNNAMQSQLRELPAWVEERAAQAGGGSQLDLTNLLLDAGVRQTLPPDVIQMLRDALTAGIHEVFGWVLITAIAGMIVVWWLPAGQPDEVHGRSEPERRS